MNLQIVRTRVLSKIPHFINRFFPQNIIKHTKELTPLQYHLSSFTNKNTGKISAMSYAIGLTEIKYKEIDAVKKTIRSLLNGELNECPFAQYKNFARMKLGIYDKDGTVNKYMWLELLEYSIIRNKVHFIPYTAMTKFLNKNDIESSKAWKQIYDMYTDHWIYENFEGIPCITVGMLKTVLFRGDLAFRMFKDKDVPVSMPDCYHHIII